MFALRGGLRFRVAGPPEITRPRAPAATGFCRTPSAEILGLGPRQPRHSADEVDPAAAALEGSRAVFPRLPIETRVAQDPAHHRATAVGIELREDDPRDGGGQATLHQALVMEPPGPG